jgi:cytochrome P450
MVTTQPVIDLNDPAYLADPYPTYARLRAETPVCWADILGWLILRHDDISALLHDPRMASGPLNDSLYETFSESALAEVEPFRTAMTHNMLLQDPPNHTRLRRLVSQAFTPRRIGSMRDAIQRITDGLLDAAEPGAPFDVIGDFAFPLPSRVIADLLGVPWEDVDRLKAWNDDGVDFLGNARTSTDPDGLAHRVGTSYVEQRAYFEDLIARHRAAPADDLICSMIAVRDSGDSLTEDELLSTCALLFAAGHETTTNLIGNAVLALLRNPDQLCLLADEPDLASAAVEEFIRYDSPVQFIYRVAMAEVPLRGQTIAPGSVLMLLLGSGNRDPEVFPDPDRLDLRRRPRHYLSFGTGAHTCLGSFLARLEAEIALTTLLRRFPSPTLVDDGPLRWHANPIFHGVQRLPVVL